MADINHTDQFLDEVRACLKTDPALQDLLQKVHKGKAAKDIPVGINFFGLMVPDW